MPATPTRTLNPLPFEHLEPKRFEDLARQLAYDFKPWRQLEATGRGGSDDGFDARGFEIVPFQGGDAVQDEGEDEQAVATAADCLWLIQCKREQSIGPAKMRAYLDDIPVESRAGLYGILFVAACDFSKKTRDAFRLWCLQHGLAECHVWGKAEIEDLLFQPKNDNLLSAYFGISLQIRKQKTATNLRRITTVKRKLRRVLDDYRHAGIAIIRDASDERYPYTEGKPLEQSDLLWRVCHLKGLGIKGLRVLLRKHYAYYDQKTGKLDLASRVNRATPDDYDNPLRNDNKDEAQRDLEMQEHEFWVSIHDDCRAEIDFIAEIPYSEILEVDDLGDAFSELPTIFVSFSNGKMPLADEMIVTATPTYGQSAEKYRLHRDDHLRVFPEQFRDTAWEAEWSGRHDFDMHANKGEITLTPPPWLLRIQKMRAGEDPNLGDDTEGGVPV